MTPKPHAQLGDRNSARGKAKVTPPKRGKVGRWSVLLEVSGGAPYRFCYRHGGTKENPAEWAEVHVVCGPKGTAARIVRALNRHGVVLPARRERG